MKKQKGRVIPSDSEILKRLDRIESKSTFFNYFAIFTFAFSMSIATVAIALAMQSFNILIGSIFMLFFAFIVLIVMIIHLSFSRSNRKKRK